MILPANLHNIAFTSPAGSIPETGTAEDTGPQSPRYVAHAPFQPSGPRLPLLACSVVMVACQAVGITSIICELLNSESEGCIDWGRPQLILPITYSECFSRPAEISRLPPAGRDKVPPHCACLICVTAFVCTEIDVAFHSPVGWPCR